MSALLNYDITPTPQPLQASPATGSPLIAQLTLVATNNSRNAVSVNWLELSIPIGTAANDLTNATSGFGINLGAGWQVGSASQSGGQYTFVFTAPNGGAIVQAGQDIVFTISNIPLVTQPGSPVLTVTEGSSGNPTQNITLTIYPNGFGAVSFIASPANINSGGNVVLSWMGPSGATYQLQYEQNGAIITIPGNGQPPLASTGSYPGQGAPALVLTQTTVFTLKVTQDINNVTFTLTPQQTVTVIAPSPVINSFSVSESAEALQLSWTTENTDYVTGSWTDFQMDANPAQPIVVQPPFYPEYIITAWSGIQAFQSNYSEFICKSSGILSPVMPSSEIGKIVIKQSALFSIIASTAGVTLNQITGTGLTFAVLSSKVITFEEILQLTYTETIKPINLLNGFWEIIQPFPVVVVKFPDKRYALVWISQSSSVSFVRFERMHQDSLYQLNLIFKWITYQAP